MNLVSRGVPQVLGERLGQALPAGYALRERETADLEFLCALYAQTREAELEPVQWTHARKQAFLADQFHKQHAHYLLHYPAANWWVVTHLDQPVGRLYVDMTKGELRLMDITLGTEHRNQGIGMALLRALTHYTDALGVEVTLHVEPFNRALRFYQRLGFQQVETRGVYLFMRRPLPGRDSVENNLVAGAVAVTADRHHEQLQPAVPRM